jgi:hypothetical protein
MRHFYIKAKVEKSLGEKADWKAVDAAMVQAAALAEKVAAVAVRVFGAFIAVVAVVVLAGLAWLWVFGA